MFGREAVDCYGDSCVKRLGGSSRRSAEKTRRARESAGATFGLTPPRWAGESDCGGVRRLGAVEHRFNCARGDAGILLISWLCADRAATIRRVQLGHQDLVAVACSWRQLDITGHARREDSRVRAACRLDFGGPMVRSTERRSPCR